MSVVLLQVTLVVRQRVCGSLHLMSVCPQSNCKTAIASSQKPFRMLFIIFIYFIMLSL